MELVLNYLWLEGAGLYSLQPMLLMYNVGRQIGIKVLSTCRRNGPDVHVSTLYKARPDLAATLGAVIVAHHTSVPEGKTSNLIIFIIPCEGQLHLLLLLLRVQLRVQARGSHGIAGGCVAGSSEVCLAMMHGGACGQRCWRSCGRKS